MPCRAFPAPHRGDADGSAAVIVGVDRQHFFIGFDSRLDVAGLFQGERAVIGFGEGFFIDFLHGGVFTAQIGVWQ